MVLPANKNEDHFVASEYLICMRDFALSKHISMKRLLKDTGQDASFLLNPPNKVNEHIMSLISGNLFNALPNSLLGCIEFGKSMAMSSHGALGLAIQGCKTLNDAALLVQHYIQTRASARKINIVSEDQYTFLRFSNGNIQNTSPAVLNIRYFTDFTTLINIEGLIRKQLSHHELIGPCVIHAPRAKPKDFPTNQLPEGLDVVFNSQYYQLGFPTSWLKLGLNQGDLELAKIAESECILTLKQLSPEDLIQQIYKVLDTASSSNIRLQSMAASLFMSPSTLQRRLRELDTTYKEIKTRVRINQAKALLKHTNKTIDSIADTLDYSDASNFTKSFKGHTGLTPKNYRLSLSN
jgi:AraC-like DNA-binding protein